MSIKKNNKTTNTTKLDDNSHVSEIIKENLTNLLEPEKSTQKDSSISLKTEQKTEENTIITSENKIQYEEITSEQAKILEHSKDIIDYIEQNITENNFAKVLENDDAVSELNSEGYIYINVMETFVKEIIIEYMKECNVCTCSHCIIDTMALALTNLPPKYIVVKKGTASPLLHVYRAKYFIRISTEVLKACITVSKSPHHIRA